MLRFSLCIVLVAVAIARANAQVKTDTTPPPGSAKNPLNIVTLPTPTPKATYYTVVREETFFKKEERDQQAAVEHDWFVNHYVNRWFEVRIDQIPLDTVTNLPNGDEKPVPSPDCLSDSVLFIPQTSHTSPGSAPPLIMAKAFVESRNAYDGDSVLVCRAKVRWRLSDMPGTQLLTARLMNQSVPTDTVGPHARHILDSLAFLSETGIAKAAAKAAQDNINHAPQDTLRKDSLELANAKAARDAIVRKKTNFERESPRLPLTVRDIDASQTAQFQAVAHANASLVVGFAWLMRAPRHPKTGTDPDSNAIKDLAKTVQPLFGGEFPVPRVLCPFHIPLCENRFTDHLRVMLGTSLTHPGDNFYYGLEIPVLIDGPRAGILPLSFVIGQESGIAHDKSAPFLELQVNASALLSSITSFFPAK